MITAERILNVVIQDKPIEPPDQPSPLEPLQIRPIPKFDDWRQGNLFEILNFVQNTFGVHNLPVEALVGFLAERNLYISMAQERQTSKIGGFIVEASKHVARVGVSKEVPSSTFVGSQEEISYRFFEDHGNEIFPSWKNKIEIATDQS